MELPMAVRKEDGNMPRGYRQAFLGRGAPYLRTCITNSTIIWDEHVCTEFLRFYISYNSCRHREQRFAAGGHDFHSAQSSRRII